MRYRLMECDKVLHSSRDFGKLIGYTASTKCAEIYYGSKLVWVQRPELYCGKHKVKS